MRSTRALLVRCLLPALVLLSSVTAQAQENASPFITRFHGKVPPPIQATERSGKPFNTGSLRGKVVIVNLWATWCAPCRAELPSLDRLAAANGRDLVVLAVSNDRGGWPTIDRFWRDQYPHLHPVLATDAQLPQKLGALGLPYTLILDRQGREIARVPRATDWTSTETRALIARAVAR